MKIKFNVELELKNDIKQLRKKHNSKDAEVSLSNAQNALNEYLKLSDVEKMKVELNHWQAKLKSLKQEYSSFVQLHNLTYFADNMMSYQNLCYFNDQSMLTKNLLFDAHSQICREIDQAEKKIKFLEETLEKESQPTNN